MVPVYPHARFNLHNGRRGSLVFFKLLQKSPSFNKFRNFCCEAFLSLRKKADLIINLFSIVSNAIEACINTILSHQMRYTGMMVYQYTGTDVCEGH